MSRPTGGVASGTAPDDAGLCRRNRDFYDALWRAARLDISVPALEQLRAAGGHVAQASLIALPFADGSFDLIVSCDVIEHVADDVAAFRELSR
ncbi:MAG: methyltransferase domain-containing protein, partial [Acetobacteraceae bacterium]